MYTPTYGPTTTSPASTVAVSTTPSVSGSPAVSTNAASGNAPVTNDNGVETPRVDVMYTVNAPNTANPYGSSDMDLREYDKYKKAVDDANKYKDEKYKEWGDAGKAYNDFYQQCREEYGGNNFPYDIQRELHNLARLEDAAHIAYAFAYEQYINAIDELENFVESSGNQVSGYFVENADPTKWSSSMNAPAVTSTPTNTVTVTYYPTGT